MFQVNTGGGGNMFRKQWTGLAAILLVACGGKGGDQAAADSLRRDLELAPAESTTALNDQPAAQPEPAPTPAPAAPAPKPAPAPAPAPKARTMTLDSGLAVTAAANDSLHSRRNKVGETFRATISEDVRDAKGNVAIPAGAVVTFTVTRLEHANNKSEKDGKLRLTAQEVEIKGETYAIAGVANQATVEHALVGQGVTAGGAARVGAGAAGGAIAGKVIGGKTGAIIGGIVGAAGGAAAAAHTADRDIVVAPGNKVTFTLTEEFTITRS
jgi:hypothetical protein